MKKLLSLILATAMVFAVMSGCADAVDINKKRIVTALMLDYKDGQVCYNVEIANIESGSSDKDKSGGEKYKYITGKGNTIAESKADLDHNLDRELYLSAIRTVVFTEEFVNGYLVEYLNRLRAEEQYRKKVIIVTTAEDPQTLIDTCIEKNLSVGFSTEEMINTLHKEGAAFSYTTEEILEKISSDNDTFVLPSINIKNETNALTGYSVISGGNIKGHISAEQAQPVVILNSQDARCEYLVDYDKQQFFVEGSCKSKKIKPSYEKGGVGFTVECTVDAILLYGTAKTPYDLTDKDYKKITELVEEEIKADILNAVDTAQNKLGYDYLRFDDAFRVKYPKQFEALNWTDAFKKAKMDASVTVNIKHTSLLDYKTNKKE